MSSRGLPALSSDAGLSRYLSEIRKFPLLTPEDEFMFAKRLKEHGDTEAAKKLIDYLLSRSVEDRHHGQSGVDGNVCEIGIS